MKLARSVLLPLALLLGTGVAAAQASGNPPAGDYIYEGGSGSLHIKPGGRFDITTIGTNAHTCALDGTIVRGKAKLDDTGCVVSFSAEADKLQVRTNGSDQCRGYCGMRAAFEGTYIRPIPS